MAKIYYKVHCIVIVIVIIFFKTLSLLLLLLLLLQGISCKDIFLLILIHNVYNKMWLCSILFAKKKSLTTFFCNLIVTFSFDYILND